MPCDPIMLTRSPLNGLVLRVAIVGCCTAFISILALGNLRAATVEDHTFIATCDGSEQRYVLVTPDAFSSDQRVDLIIALHGHGSDRWQFVRQDRGECRAVRDVAATRGALLVSPDYRAKTSWMGPKAEADVVQIIESMKSEFRIGRVILCGGSMGGTGALTFAALHPDLIDAVVSLNGTANLVEYERFLDAIAESYGGTKQQIPDEYRRRSAEFAPDRFTMPLAVTTGGGDEIVPADSVLRLVENVQHTNRHVLSLHRPDGGHSTTYDDTKQALEFVFRALQNL
ncbi:2-hydroxy-6-oxononadienedioate/2-hydroxy-6-oxononatrienedioate hydrolase [Rosistilla oblonga]|uniref:2-hydroxy-6-oxononadienedioate/2-hydroxy-6-oxononatrienedioate hydrolase n=2 Tax=Rosistilla oblonga TaxID=2527990 RepID=A0A518INH9_9BACT|nr:2-hydroxy-6-oxononadienedioate/2-hydroxy-6-oxononatrienedioate hydrolase [Rosistilla oblonga]